MDQQFQHGDSTAEEAALRQRLAIHQGNLRHLLWQRSTYGEGQEPIRIMNQVNGEQAAIRTILQQLGEPNDSVAVSLIDSQSRLFPSYFATTYPLPIAQTCANFNQAREIGRQFIALDSLIQHTIKYLAALFIGQARRDTLPAYSLPQQLRWMAHPTLEHWINTVETLSQIYTQRQSHLSWMFASILESCIRPLINQPHVVQAAHFLATQLHTSVAERPSALTLLQLIARYAVQQWDDAPTHYPYDRIETIIGTLQPALVAILDALEPLRRFPLVYIERADTVASGVRLRMVRFMGQITEDITRPGNQFPILPQQQLEHVRIEHFYIAEEQGIPQLDLHPFFVLYRWELYHLACRRSDDFVEYRSCSRGTRFIPPAESSTYYTSWLKEAPEVSKEEQVPPLLGADTSWQALVELRPKQDQGEEAPLTWLSKEGRTALELALGEALRLGHFWLGLEFLLMGLSKQDGTTLPTILDEMQVDSTIFRGHIRALVGAAENTDWQSQDVALLGASALMHLQRAIPQIVRQEYLARNSSFLILTPRMTQVLQEANALAGQFQLGHDHLLRAALIHNHVPAVRSFFEQAQKIGWTPTKLATRLNLPARQGKRILKNQGSLPPQRLLLEVCSGPLDGVQEVVTSNIEWSRNSGQIMFPWDVGLGIPQARIIAHESGWLIESTSSPHGTYLRNTRLPIEGQRRILEGDILRASKTWLLVRQATSTKT